MTIRQFKTLLLTVGVEVFHFESHKQSEYIVWYEIGGIRLSGDNSIAESGTMIAVDFYTKQEYSVIPERITETLSGCDSIAVDDPTIIFDEETKLIHYAWTCEVI